MIFYAIGPAGLCVALPMPSVADAHDLLEVSTRYLTDKDANMNDENLPIADDGMRCSAIASMFWTISSIGEHSTVCVATLIAWHTAVSCSWLVVQCMSDWFIFLHRVHSERGSNSMAAEGDLGIRSAAGHSNQSCTHLREDECIGGAAVCAAFCDHHLVPPSWQVEALRYQSPARSTASIVPGQENVQPDPGWIGW